jgi:hypothetical protein
METTTYVKDLEAIAKKYDYWDNSKSPYAFLVGYENDSQPGVVQKFLTKRMKGGTTFRECVQKMLNSCDPDIIIVEEFTGVKGVALNNYPTRIRVSDEKSNANMAMERRSQPLQSTQAVVENVFEGLGGIEGFEGIKNGLGALLTVERERHTRDMMIDRLNYEQKFREMEVASKMERLTEKLEILQLKNNELEAKLKKAELAVATLEDENEELELENEKYKPNKMLKDVGIGALTNVAMQLATKSPALRGLLGIDEEPVEPAKPQPSMGGNVGVKMDESNLTDGQKIALRTVNDIAEALITWPIPHLERFIKMMAFVEDNEERQLEMLEYITEQIEEGN